MKVIKFVFSFLHDLRLTFIVYCLLSLITGGIAIYTPIINEKFIDILTGTIQGSYTSYIVQFCAISIINLGITYFIKVLSVKLQRKSSYGIVSKTICHLSESGILYGNDSVYAYISQRIKSDADAISSFFIDATAIIPVNSVVGIISGCILFYYNKTIFIILAFLAIGYSLLYLILKEPLKKAGLRSKQASDIYYSKIEMSVSKQQFAKVHGVFNRFQLFLKNAFDVDLLSAINFQKIAFLNFSLEGIIGAVAQAAIYITGGALILGHQLSIGGFVVIVVYFAYVTNAIKRIFSLNENYQLARAAHERLQEYLCMPLSTDGGLTTLEILSIEYKAVGFSFGERFQLSNINLAFRKGTLYGLCGKNGSGKTTLMLLLLGIYPNYRGEILINGINQKQYNLKKLRSCVIHYTEQTPVFFDEPMVKNFELFEGERRPFLQVKTYIQMLGLHNIVSLEDDALRFSEHYQYSAGELAKIAILRSLVLKKSVYIWDEPDTALDEAAKQALIKILKELSNEAIVVIITHNSDLLNACETIYHL